MNKRGQASDQILEAGKLIFYVIVAILLFAVGTGLWDIFVKEKPTDILRDRDRIAKELDALRPDQRIEVITSSKDPFLVQLFGSGNSQKGCGGNSCVCVVEKGETKCTVLKKVSDDCSKMCAAKTENLGKQPDAGSGKPVLICSKGTQVFIGDGC